MARSLLFVLFLLVAGAFALLNWQAFSTPTTVSLLVATVEAPIGLIMLVLLAITCLSFIAWAFALQGHALMDSRRMTKELQAQRDLADKAEASRFTELRMHLDAGLADTRRTIEQQANSLAANIAVLEDRMERSPPRTGDRLIPAPSRTEPTGTVHMAQNTSPATQDSMRPGIR